MPAKKPLFLSEKTALHPRNKHRELYNFSALCIVYPPLAPFVAINKFGNESADFFNPEAVKMLNTALLMQVYDIRFWEIPEGYLCPSIPGRADYMHYAADLLAQTITESDKQKIPTGSQITCLDVGVGANCVYPIIGHHEYGWHFIGADVDAVSIANAEKIVAQNDGLKNAVALRLQSNANHVFEGILSSTDFVDVVICNPPFHASLADAEAGTKRKLSNLKHKKVSDIVRNFNGKANELWCEGGEKRFVQNMIFESARFAENCLWFTSLISKESNLKAAYLALKKVGAARVKTIAMAQGNKTSRILAWTFFTPEQQQFWIKKRWKS